MHGSSNYAFAVRFLLKWRFKQVPDSVSAKVTFAKGQVGFVVVSLYVLPVSLYVLPM